MFSSSNLNGWVTARESVWHQLGAEGEGNTVDLFQKRKEKITRLFTMALSNSYIFAEHSDKYCTDFNIRVLVCRVKFSQWTSPGFPTWQISVRCVRTKAQISKSHSWSWLTYDRHPIRRTYRLPSWDSFSKKNTINPCGNTAKILCQLTSWRDLLQFKANIIPSLALVCMW